MQLYAAIKTHLIIRLLNFCDYKPAYLEQGRLIWADETYAALWSFFQTHSINYVLNVAGTKNSAEFFANCGSIEYKSLNLEDSLEENIPL